jgi:alkylated DNA repair dioxygenase AlkB
MIRHYDPVNNGPERSRYIRSLIRQGRIAWGGNIKLKIYGTLSCTSGKRMKPVNRVFFSTGQEAITAGYRPCGHCLREEYLAWKRAAPAEHPNTPANTLIHQPNMLNEPANIPPNMLNMTKPSAQNMLSSQGEAWFYPHFFSPASSDLYYETLQREIPWQQQPVKIFGKTVMQPRLTAWYGDPGISYSYSGITLQPRPWTDTLRMIKQEVEAIAGVVFTGALLNLYRDGKDSMGWHRDNEKELGINPVIGSVSFGATRRFQLRKYEDKSGLLSLDLDHGSYLLMKGETQHYWEHRVAKTASPTGSRINITFRVIDPIGSTPPRENSGPHIQ